MSSLQYYSAPGFGQITRDAYGFSDACVLENRIEVTGQVGINPETLQVPQDLNEEVNQAFDNLQSVMTTVFKEINHTMKRKDDQPATAWDYVVKITSYHVKLSRNQPEMREIMVRLMKERFTHHQPLFTMIGVESLPLEDTNVEIEALVYINQD